jgi:hypothetical protein
VPLGSVMRAGCDRLPGFCSTDLAVLDTSC